MLILPDTKFTMLTASTERAKPPRKTWLNPPMVKNTSIATKFKYEPKSGFSTCASGSKVSEAPKPICNEKNCPAVEKVANTSVIKKPIIIPMTASPASKKTKPSPKGLALTTLSCAAQLLPSAVGNSQYAAKPASAIRATCGFASLYRSGVVSIIASALAARSRKIGEFAKISDSK